MKRNGILGIGLMGWVVGCGGISDCKEDGAKCAEMLNANAEKCATAYQLVAGEPKKKHCEAAIKLVGDQKIQDAVPGLIKVLEVPESNVPEDKHREHAAKALQKIGDASAVDPLMNVLDFSAGSSSDPKDKNASRSNEAVATALGRLGDKKAAPKLRELLKNRNNYVVLKAIRALGELKDGDAVDLLSKMALEHENKFMRKNAVVALGDIGDLKATDTLIEMMFVEFQGVSFYKEASFALYQLGSGVADALLSTMAGKNNRVNKYFEKSGGLKDTAIKAKCGFVLGDLRDSRAVEPLIEAFTEAQKNNDPVVMVYAAAPLGALGDKRAVSVLEKAMLDLDASKRDPIMRALNQLGDRSVAADMIAAMAADHFVQLCIKEKFGTKEECAHEDNKPSVEGAQKAAADHGSNLAGPEHLGAYKAISDAEQDPKIKEYFVARQKRLEAAVECKDEAPCWVKKLKDPDAFVREKAAWELGRLKDPNTMDALLESLSDKKPEARSAAIMAYWSFGDKRAVPAIKKTLEDEESSADFIRVNEDLRRLLVHLER